MRKKTILLRAIEYRSERSGDLRTKGPALYIGIRARSTDGRPCVVVRSPDARRNFHVDISSVQSVTTRNGTRHPILASPEDPRQRVEEVRWLLEKTREPWVAHGAKPGAPHRAPGPRATGEAGPAPGSPPPTPKPKLFAAWDRLVQSVFHKAGVQ